jgi:hypothetical protein
MFGILSLDGGGIKGGLHRLGFWPPRRERSVERKEAAVRASNPCDRVGPLGLAYYWRAALGLAAMTRKTFSR